MFPQRLDSQAVVGFGEPGEHRRDRGQGVAGACFRRRSDPDRDPAASGDFGKPVFVGHIVAEKNRAAAEKWRLSRERRRSRHPCQPRVAETRRPSCRRSDRSAAPVCRHSVGAKRELLRRVPARRGNAAPRSLCLSSRTRPLRAPAKAVSRGRIWSIAAAAATSVIGGIESAVDAPSLDAMHPRGGPAPRLEAADRVQRAGGR